MSRHALISGASIAGPALAHQLAERGWRTTVVERASRLRDEGQNIDVRGAGREVLRRMDLEDAALAAGTGEVGLRFVDDDGAAVAEFPAGEGDTAGGTAEMEILRGELSRLVYERTRERTDYRFGEQIADVTDHGDGVTARLTGGEEIDADLLVVAEGTRSRTRELVLPGAEVTELGLQVAYLTIPRTEDDDRWWRWHSAPGSRSTSLRPDNRGTTRAMLAFLSDVRGLGELDRDAQLTVLRRTYADVGWQAPRVLAALDHASLYFDDVAQIRLPRWSTGRAVVLGDAAWATGPFGTGTTLALVGAYILAGELGGDGDVHAALARYEERMRPFVAQAQDVKPAALRAMNPRSGAGLAVQRKVLGLAGSLSSVFGGLVEKFASPPAEGIELPDYHSAA
ncbi:2-polyprenyl-6-methoxyphenol hydroxylase-like FAD-dependent oxidoreductase [Actinomycetospora succinea]|uniref:2-polyprenyl-6-methoxyphenol hydroxylase-like FAD-dependent oxidoreductase n=1 Tax=Actinomycetospora succinea TaxID=663603 RepID=A0A4R6VDD2_9PSEU|nr:FAD-dependent monooxygenase [Actinomycetospora succinea]TDQ60803.1 2-polyprenyl-6-methoxyphenol hydroxylase-like FAD-dependent oxidoreductase [Actinomycetospora succinea]